MGKILGVHNQLNWNRVGKSLFTRTYVDKCRMTCQQEYFLDEDEPEFIPPPDPTLGLSAANPGKDCRDILENGGGAIS